MALASPQWRLLLRRLAGLLVIVSVPLFLIAGSVAWAVNDPGVYRRGFEKYQISLYTGIAHDDLIRIGAELRHYFNSSEEPLRVVAPVFGEEREIFNQKEVLHMRDVKVLFQGTYWVAGITFAYIVAFKLAGYAIFRRAFAREMSWLGLWGGLLTLGIVLAVGLFALVGFESLFILFHRIGFANDLWQLDPRTDYLLIMFPLGFWFDATMRVALTTITAAVLLVLLCAGYLYWTRR